MSVCVFEHWAINFLPGAKRLKRLTQKNSPLIANNANGLAGGLAGQDTRIACNALRANMFLT
jgi:hypothetical protein